MIVPRHLLPLVLALLFTAHVFAVTPPETPRFAHERSDLKPDPATRFGTLPNGLRYAVLANHEPKERASLRLVVLAGSFHENEDQRGLAHFLEHMAFNGSTHYPPGTLIEYFQRLGMSFGGDTNAYTSFDHTAYMIELPDTKPGTLDEGFKVFSDYAGGLLLVESELNKERGIILSELRARDSVEYRQTLAEMGFVLGDTRLPSRMPIGLIPVIEKAPRDAFLDFYNTWYQPSRMAIVAVGDFDAAAVEKQIAAAFSSLAPRTTVRPAPDLGKLPAFDGVRTRYHHEAEAGATTVGIQTASPAPLDPDTSANRLARLPRDLALAMLDRRLDILAKKEDAPFTNAHVGVNDSFELVRNALIELTCKPTQWSAALGVAEQELRRALEHGFQPAELREATANVINDLEQAVKTASTRRSEALARELVSALVQDEVFTTPADDLALFKPALEKVTPEQCATALRTAFSVPGRFVTVMGNAKLDATPAGSPDAQIRATYEKSRATRVAPPAQLTDSAFAYADFGPAGQVTSRRHVDDLDLDLVAFANNVRLNFKKTDFEAGKIRLSLRIGAGRMTEPKDKPGLSFFTDSVLLAGGLGQHSFDDLGRILAGKTINLIASGMERTFRVGGDALVFNTLTNRDDLLLQLQLITAYITDPGFRPEAARVAQKNFEQLYTRLAHIPDGPLQLEVPRLLASGDPRFGLPAKDALLSRTLDEARAWIAPQFAQGPIELAIVGDFDPEALVDAVARTLGALPARQPKPAYEAERQVAFPTTPFAKDFVVSTEIPKGYVALYWPTTDSRDIHIVRRLSVLTEILNDRLRVKIREELGDSYSPSASSGPSDTYRDYGLTTALVSVDPAKAKIVTDAIAEIADDLAKNGVNEDELDRAKKPILTSLREAGRNNPYWIYAVLGSAQEQPQRLDWRRSIDTDFAAINKADIDALAKKYLPAAKAFRVTSLPAPKASSAAKP